ncbi:MAG TPA: hypothetical protein VME40_07180 [Caulobacteraceae bacterium]|nr:hypothetical protein [Caulobacteraceae bacterium]
MSAILYPVAASAEAAVSEPVGRAAREREARAAAGGPVEFVSEEVGPAYASREAALDANVGRLDDERPGRLNLVAPEDRFCLLRERAETAPTPVEPAFAKGRRWPKPSRTPKTSFRLAVSYWRIADAPAAPPPGQARALRRAREAAQLDAAQLRALARQPLRPVRPQQPLDHGLFEAPAPEAPHILIPDE